MTPIEIITTHINAYLYELRMRGCHDAANRIGRECGEAIQALQTTDGEKDEA
jgi:hypothetical protein